MTRFRQIWNPGCYSSLTSDVLQNDFLNLFSEDIKRQILICTPEKLSYVLHHDPFFLSAIDLFVFDEGHMFDDGGRGATYELLVTHIRQNMTSEQQLVLLSAVLSNSGEYCTVVV